LLVGVLLVGIATMNHLRRQRPTLNEHTLVGIVSSAFRAYLDDSAKSVAAEVAALQRLKELAAKGELPDVANSHELAAQRAGLVLIGQAEQAVGLASATLSQVQTELAGARKSLASGSNNNYHQKRVEALVQQETVAQKALDTAYQRLAALRGTRPTTAAPSGESRAK
jgi:hypothetical protein